MSPRWGPRTPTPLQAYTWGGASQPPLVTGGGSTLPGASTMPVGEEAALRTTGFVTAGIVTAGAVVAYPIKFGMDDALTARHRGGYTESFSQSNRKSIGEGAMHGWLWERVLAEQRGEGEMRAALERLETEAQTAGAHGVLGVTFASTHRTDVPGRWAGVLALTEVIASGTAVVAPGQAPLDRPFTCHLGGAATAKLLMAGWVPTSLAVGVGVIAGTESSAAARASASLRNAEMVQASRAVTQCWRIATARLERSVAGRGSAIVGLETRRQLTATSKHALEARVELIGTAVRAMSDPPARLPLNYLTVVPVSGPASVAP